MSVMAAAIASIVVALMEIVDVKEFNQRIQKKYGCETSDERKSPFSVYFILIIQVILLFSHLKV